MSAWTYADLGVQVKFEKISHFRYSLFILSYNKK